MVRSALLLAENRYRQLLLHCLDNRGAVLLFAAVIIISLPVLFSLAQQELAPEEDQADLFVMASPPIYANIEYINRFVDETVAIGRASRKSDLPGRSLPRIWPLAVGSHRLG